MRALLLDDPAHRRRVIDFQRRPLPEPKVYSPRLRRDQIKPIFDSFTRFREDTSQ